MGFAGALFGADSGNTGGAGLNYEAGSAGIKNPLEDGQLTTAWNNTQQGLTQQQDFLNALAAQNGVSNQSSVFNQQQALANQLQGIANGTGPNPALAQLANSTGANTANQAALMAGQRGAGANVGLIARQAAQQGAATQQQAAGQAAVLAAQQQLAGINALQGQQAQLAGTAGAQVGEQANTINAYNQAAQSQQANVLNAASQYNNALVNNQASQNSANSGVSQQAAAQQGKLFGGVLNGAGAAVGLAKGGMVPKYANGTPDAPVGSYPAPMAPVAGGPSSSAGRFLFSSAQNQNGQMPQSFNISGQANSAQDPLEQGGEAIGKGAGKGIKSLFGSSESAPQMSSDNSSLGDMISAQDAASGETMIDGGSSLGDMVAAMPAAFAKGGPINGEQLASKGKLVPGKAKVKGDSLKNDVVDAKLSPGEIIIPRSVVNSKDPVNNAAKFVSAVLAKQNLNKNK